jgi:hypothetical protein
MSQTNTPEENLIALYKKLHGVKKELGVLSKSSANPFFKSKYADLNTHLAAVEPLLEKNNLVLTQPVVVAGQLGNAVKTEITDADTGAQISSVMALGTIEDMQKLGSAITYARRYTLGALFGMQAEDDDANAATGKKTMAPKTRASRGDF